MRKFKKFSSILISFILVLSFVACGSTNKDVSNSNITNNKVVINSIDDLKDTNNFRNGALEHVLEGEVNSRGKAVGYHYEGFPTSKGEVIEGTKSKLNEDGIYTAKVKVDGVDKTSNGGKSSFFPEDWSAQDVVDRINETYESKVFVKGTDNTYRGETKDGVVIEMYIDTKTDKIISAFPVY